MRVKNNAKCELKREIVLLTNHQGWSFGFGYSAPLPFPASLNCRCNREVREGKRVLEKPTESVLTRFYLRGTQWARFCQIRTCKPSHHIPEANGTLRWDKRWIDVRDQKRVEKPPTLQRCMSCWPPKIHWPIEKRYMGRKSMRCIDLFFLLLIDLFIFLSLKRRI